MNKERSVFLLAGATATGKSSVVQFLAERHNAIIVSADAMLVYRGMDIGTAKPTSEERWRVKYYGVDCVLPGESFNVNQWLEAIRPAFDSDKDIFITGGTGLYFSALMNGLDEMPSTNEEKRAFFTEMFEKGGLEALYKELVKFNVDVAVQFEDPKNHRRLIRALEVLDAGGTLPQGWKVKKKFQLPALFYERPLLHQRIEERVHLMYDKGLLAETENLLKTYPVFSATASTAIGYAEAADVLRGNITKPMAIERTIIRTRQLAKRQETWFRHQASVDWLKLTEVDTLESVATQVFSYWRKNGTVRTSFD